ncbi:Moesin/ezrin/radixin 2 [Fasciolopsis buskii]|uniref:Moesin/ezrin/radixin 2 n=1 Tax=Fasciolopsis buskii TaxID=27845 RepID=A0A8E0VPS2_9TREM|nr:Moesin/ezrin/radixin 2 [Fasciolopsis buski]
MCLPKAEYGDLCEDELDDKDDPNFLPTRLLRLIPVQLVQHVRTNQVLAQKLRECYKSYKGINRLMMFMNSLIDFSVLS